MWQEKLVDALQIASILSAAGFAAFALFTEYKKDGRITKYGRFAVIGIVLSALFSLGTQWGKDEIDRIKDGQRQAAEDRKAEEARKAADEELGRYREQMNRLGGLSDQQKLALDRSRDLAGRMQQSLRRQLALQQEVRGTLNAVEDTRNQEQANTSRVLRTMWDDANRINASGLSLAVTYQCGPVSSNQPFPLWLAENTEAVVRVASITSERRARLPNRVFSSQPLLGDESSAEFKSTDQRVTVTRMRSVDGDEVDQVSRFASFTSPNLKGFDSPDRWSNVAVEILLRGFGARLGDAIKVLDDKLGDKVALGEYYDVGGILGNDDYSATMLPCPVLAELSVNGRPVAEAEGRLVQVHEWDEDVSGRVVVKFPIVAGAQGVFPAFALEERAGTPAGRAARPFVRPARAAMAGK